MTYRARPWAGGEEAAVLGGRPAMLQAGLWLRGDGHWRMRARPSEWGEGRPVLRAETDDRRSRPGSGTHRWRPKGDGTDRLALARMELRTRCRGVRSGNRSGTAGYVQPCGEASGQTDRPRCRENRQVFGARTEASKAIRPDRLGHRRDRTRERHHRAGDHGDGPAVHELI